MEKLALEHAGPSEFLHKYMQKIAFLDGNSDSDILVLFGVSLQFYLRHVTLQADSIVEITQFLGNLHRWISCQSLTSQPLE